MFGLQNFSGSCWVNAALQGIFRIPEVKDRYSGEANESDIDKSLKEIWSSQGKNGLRDFFISVKTATMPAGQSVGDSHELIVHLCDKLPFLDKLCRFGLAENLKCSSCDFTQLREDTSIEFTLQPGRKQVPISECIGKAVTPVNIPDWKCEKCKKTGCTKQMLIASFPKVMIFNVTDQGTVQYSSVLVLNSRKYYLMSVVSFNGGHWWAYSREMPPGKPWYTFNDIHVRQHNPTEFPLSDTMKVLIYYRLDE